MKPKKSMLQVAHSPGCNYTQRLLASRDAVAILSGKWKIPILCTLHQRGKMRFTEVLQAVPGIAAKMLSKELQDLEANELLTRTVCNTKPITVEYELTTHGKSLHQILIDIINWGETHRRKIMSPAPISSIRQVTL
jgi:DNA-binding HxlR family transcriptional regulator